MERETRVRIRGGKWTTRLAFFSFLPSRLFVSGKLKPVDTSNRLRSQPFSSTSNAPFALRCRATTLPTPKLNQEIPFAFRRAYGVSQMEARRRSNHGNEGKVSFFFVSKKARPSYLLIFVQQRLRYIGHLCCNDLTYFDEISFKV